MPDVVLDLDTGFCFIAFKRTDHILFAYLHDFLQLKSCLVLVASELAFLKTMDLELVFKLSISWCNQFSFYFFIFFYLSWIQLFYRNDLNLQNIDFLTVVTYNFVYKRMYPFGWFWHLLHHPWMAVVVVPETWKKLSSFVWFCSSICIVHPVRFKIL